MAPRFVKIGSARQVEASVTQWLAAVEADRLEMAWAALRKVIWMPLLRALPDGTRVARVSGEGDLVRIPWHSFTQRQPATPLDVVKSARRARSYTLDPRNAPPPPPIASSSSAGWTMTLAGRSARQGIGICPFNFRSGSTSKKRERSKGWRGRTHPNWWPLWQGRRRHQGQAVLQNITRATYLHFATHGFVPDDLRDEAAASAAGGSERTPLVDSGIALSGANVRDPASFRNVGMLTAEEILDADMTSARMVALSACKTGLGVKASGQGILGCGRHCTRPARSGS